MAVKMAAAAMLAVMAMLLAMEAATVEAQNCSPVVAQLSGCLGYLRPGSTVAKPPPACCNGVQGLYKSTLNSRPARQNACGCIKSSAASLGLNQGRISSLPNQCGVNLGYAISASTNCKTIP